MHADRTLVQDLPSSTRDPVRGFLYSLVARLLLVRPGSMLTDRLLGADRIVRGQREDIQLAWQRLVMVALLLGPRRTADEFDNLFILPDEPIQLVASRHLARCDRKEHLGTLCEMMGVMPDRRQFFQHRIAPWYRAALLELEGAPGAHFYRHVAGFCCAFLDSEEHALRPLPSRHPPA